MIRRLFYCQSGIQLVGAVVAARTCSAASGEHETEDRLVFANGSIDETVMRELARAVSEMARGIHQWHTVVALEPRDLPLREVIVDRRWDAAARTVRQKIGVAACDELYVPKEYGRVAGLLHLAYPKARTICYGDGAGLNFSPHYFAAEFAGRQVPETSAAPAERRRRVLQETLLPAIPEIESETRCLLLPNLFDEAVDRVVVPDEAAYRDYFARLAAARPGAARSTHDQPWSGLTEEPYVAIVLTSNLSEFGKMTQASELAAYAEFLRGRVKPGAAVLIKPHPLDAVEKIERLAVLLSGNGLRVSCWEAAEDRFLPLEALLPEVFASLSHVQKDVFCFSTSCLSLELLYRIPCQLGFGEALVRKYFAPDCVDGRLRHETHVSQAVDRIRREAEGVECT